MQVVCYRNAGSSWVLLGFTLGSMIVLVHSLFFVGLGVGAEVSESMRIRSGNWTRLERCAFGPNEFPPPYTSCFPAPRSFCRAVSTQVGTLFVYGGRSEVQGMEQPPHMWKYIVGEGWSISFPKNTSLIGTEYINARDSHSMVRMPFAPSSLFVFGGLSSIANRCNFTGIESCRRVGGSMRVMDDAWIFDTDSELWSSVTTTGTIPAARQLHSAVVLLDDMYVFGGMTMEASPFSTFHRIRLASGGSQFEWTTLSPPNPTPSARYGHQSWSCSTNRIFVHSGMNSARETISDLWEYDVDQNTWSLVPSYSSEFDRSLALVSGPTLNGHVYISGGLGTRINTDVLSDVVVFDCATRSLSWLVSSDAEANRDIRSHGACGDLNGGQGSNSTQFFLYGGQPFFSANPQNGEILLYDRFGGT